MNADPNIDVIKTISEQPAALFTDPALSVTVLVERLKQRENGVVADLGTDKGRKAIASRAFAISKLKTAIDGAGKDQNAELREQINSVDVIRREVRSALDELRDEIRKPLEIWEQQEKARIEQHKALIERIVQTSYVAQSDTSADIQTRIEWLEGLDLSELALQEFSDHAKGKSEFALAQLRPALDRAKQQEAERAELDRLRRENEERQAKEAAEQAERDRIAKEEKDKREAAEREARAADEARKAAEEKAEREKQDLIRKQKEADQARLAAEQREKDEAEARARDKAHRATINNGAAQAIMAAGQIGEDRARKIVTAICSGEVPNVSISY